jgi:hypothetical protein
MTGRPEASFRDRRHRSATGGIVPPPEASFGRIYPDKYTKIELMLKV